MPIKVGIVGMNSIAHSHAPHYVASELAEIVGICDVVQSRADAGAEKYGGKAYYRLRDMLEDQPEMQLVDCATGGLENGSWHFEPAMEAMSAGRHVMVEKPLSADIVEGRQMVALAAEKKVVLACNLNHYFTPPAAQGRGLIDAGELGEAVYCLMKMGFHGGHQDNYMGPGSPKVKGWPYFHVKAFLTHPFSVMRYFCGEATHVQAFCGAPGFRRAGGDLTLSTISAHLRYANGGVGYLMSQRGDASYGLGGWWSCEVAGTRGTFVVENCIEKLLWWKAPRGGGVGAPEAPPEVTESGTTDFGRTFKHRIDALLEDLTHNLPPEEVRANGRDALAALELTFAVIESYEQGGAMVRPHPLPPLHGDPLTLR